MGTYSACILGVRLRNRHHGKNIHWQWKRGSLGVSRSVGQEGGFGPSGIYLDFHIVLVKIYLGKPYTSQKLSFCSFIWFSLFFIGISFLQKKKSKKNWIQFEGGLKSGINMVLLLGNVPRCICPLPTCTVRLISIVLPQIEGNFTMNPGGLNNLFYGCID